MTSTLASASEPLPVLMGKYRLLAELERGGVATVFLAVAKGPNNFSKLVVVKMVRQQLAGDAIARKMFLEEARLAGRLNHPNIVQTLEVLEEQGRCLTVMEFLEGQSLEVVLRRCERQRVEMPLAYQLRCVIDALEGLHYAHELRDFDGAPLNLVHGDASPHNVFINYNGQVKMLDFGIAKAVTSSHSDPGFVKGKIVHMAPELLLGEAIDRRTDIYSIGTILWQIATGNRLWRGVPESQVMDQVLGGVVPDPRRGNPQVDPELARIVVKAMDPDPRKRYQSCAQLQRDLETFMEVRAQRASTRELSSFVSDLFSDAREEMAYLVESQLAILEDWPVDSSVRVPLPMVIPASVRSELLAGGGNAAADGALDLDLGAELDVPFEQELKPQRLRGEAADDATWGPPDSFVRAAARQASMAHESQGRDSGAVLMSDGTGAIARDDATATGLETRPGELASSRVVLGAPVPLAEPKSRNMLLLMAALMGTVVVAVVAVALVMRGFGGPADVASSGNAAGLVHSAPAAATQVPGNHVVEVVDEANSGQVTIEVRAEPSSSRISIDGVRVDANPAISRVLKSNREHVVKVEASGYETREMHVSAQRDVVLTVVLQRQGPGRARAGASRRAPGKADIKPETAKPDPTPPPPTAPASTSPASARDRIKDLDKNNPWK